jgi:hypothetical protein
LIAAHFEQSAQACAAMDSPFMARLLRALIKVLDGRSVTGQRVLGWRDESADALPMRLAGALHALVLHGLDHELAAIYPPLQGGDFELVLASAIARNDSWISKWLDSPPQTNETGRSAVLLPGFLEIARKCGLPLALNELGSSAGLNLFFDQFRYSYDGKSWGNADYPVTLSPELRGLPPNLGGSVSIPSRNGCDVAPLDVRSEADRLRLRAFIWADQPQRTKRLDAAIAVAQKGAFNLVKEDAETFVKHRLAMRKSGQCFTLFHSVVWQYFTEEKKAAIDALMQQAGSSATPEMPLAWLRMEALSNTDSYSTLQLTLWPDGQTRCLAKADFHGRWIEWLEQTLEFRPHPSPSHAA